MLPDQRLSPQAAPDRQAYPKDARRPGHTPGAGERSRPDRAPWPAHDQRPQPRLPSELLSAQFPADVPGRNPEPGQRVQVRRVSVRGQILDALRAALVEGELAPGEVYSAPVLGERFGVSATPVREAMQQLAGEGAVEVVPNRGFRVICHSARELAELAEVRALIEVPVVLRLAGSIPAGRWAELSALAEATALPAGCADRVGYAVSDRAFHRALLGLGGNQQLVRTVDELHRRAQWPRLSGHPSCHRAALLAHAAQHTVLLDALSARDLPLVESLVRDHFTEAAQD